RHKHPSTNRYQDPLPEGALARLGCGRFQYSFPLDEMAFSPDGKTLALSGYQDHFHLVDVATGKETKLLEGYLPDYEDTIWQVANAGGGKSLVFSTGGPWPGPRCGCGTQFQTAFGLL